MKEKYEVFYHVNMNKSELIKLINAERKNAGEQWVFFHGNLNGIPVRLKFFKTSIQLMYVGHSEINYSGPMDCSVKAFLGHLDCTFSLCDASVVQAN